MKIIYLFLLLAVPSLLFSQSNKKISGGLPEPRLTKYEIQIAAGIPIDVAPVNVFITETNFYYQFEEGFYLGGGVLYAKDFENKYISPNISAIAQFNKDNISPYVKIAAGPNFTNTPGSSGLYFSLGGGAKYVLSDKIDLTTELVMKSFSYSVNTTAGRNRINYSYFIPYAGIWFKL